MFPESGHDNAVHGLVQVLQEVEDRGRAQKAVEPLSAEETPHPVLFETQEGALPAGVDPAEDDVEQSQDRHQQRPVFISAMICLPGDKLTTCGQTISWQSIDWLSMAW
jgi:hypothetical protein